MNTAEREGFKDQLRAMAVGRGDGIDIDTPVQWVIEDLKQPAPFFEHLPELLPEDSVLYIEGTSIISEAAALYSSYRAPNAVCVVRDTIWPVPDVYHLSFSSELCARLRQLAENRPVAELFDHIKAYRSETLLFSFHDAFDGWLCISDHIPEEAVTRFCNALGLSSRRGETKRRDPEQLRRILSAFEHPDKVKFRVEGESWFGRMWRQLKRR